MADTASQTGITNFDNVRIPCAVAVELRSGLNRYYYNVEKAKKEVIVMDRETRS